ncbi:MAG: ribonuclease Y [Chlamydiales bacterium]|nr:ribonuclease Y [Chlamydiales bacterium]
MIYKAKRGGFEKLAREILSNAQAEAEKQEQALARQLKEREFDFQKELDQKSEKMKARLERREDKLDRQLELVETKLAEITRREKVARKAEELQQSLAAKERALTAELERLSTLTEKEAQVFLLEKAANEIREESAKLTLRMKKEAEEEGRRLAAQIIATAINRIAIPTTSEVSVVTVSLPNQEMKGRVIGREGRNIRALEQLTGVTFTVDDTPNTVVISGFDPVRKEIAKQTLKELIQDGRIHPTRIEEVVKRTRERVHEEILEFGEEAAARSLVLGLHPELLRLLGKLRFRFSYGQNVLEHSIEVSNLMGIIAVELGLDAQLARRIGLLHDIGKAISHEVEGSHALIGHDFALKYGENEAVANGIGCHHEEILPSTIEGSLCGAADRISGGRPGARVEAIEQYLKRAQKLEQISSQFEGVEQAYALQAGREIRVIVEPERFDDLGTIGLARDIAKRIEQELSYPGKIKVTVIREKRAVEYAT